MLIEVVSIAIEALENGEGEKLKIVWAWLLPGGLAVTN